MKEIEATEEKETGNEEKLCCKNKADPEKRKNCFETEISQAN